MLIAKSFRHSHLNGMVNAEKNKYKAVERSN
jgi:hypothetical protein